MASRGRRRAVPYEEIAEKFQEVVRVAKELKQKYKSLIDETKYPYAKVAHHFGICESTVKRAVRMVRRGNEHG